MRIELSFSALVIRYSMLSICSFHWRNRRHHQQLQHCYHPYHHQSLNQSSGEDLDEMGLGLLISIILSHFNVLSSWDI